MEISLAMSLLLKNKKLRNLSRNKMLEIKEHITQEIKKMKKEGKTNEEIKSVLQNNIDSILSSENQVNNENKSTDSNNNQQQQSTDSNNNQQQQSIDSNNNNQQQQSTDSNNLNQTVKQEPLDASKTKNLLNDVSVKELMIKG